MPTFANTVFDRSVHSTTNHIPSKFTPYISFGSRNDFVKTLKTNPYVGKKTINQLCTVYLVNLGQSKCSETPAYWDSDKPKTPVVNCSSVTFNLNVFSC